LAFHTIVSLPPPANTMSSPPPASNVLAASLPIRILAALVPSIVPVASRATLTLAVSVLPGAPVAV